MRVDAATLLAPKPVVCEDDLELHAAMRARGFASIGTSAGRCRPAPPPIGQAIRQVTGPYRHAGFLPQGAVVDHVRVLQ